MPTSVPAGCAIQSATLRLHSPSATNGRTLQAFVLSTSWTENGITWANQPTTTGTAATTPSGSGQRNWDVTSQVTVNFTNVANNGFLIRDSAEGGTGFEQQFQARNGSQGQRPVLIVTYRSAP
jgi:hypothetical protein